MMLEPRLHARERRLELEIVGDALLVREHAAHVLGGENVAEDDRNRVPSQACVPP